jgi:YidC/Oxa1 family membrane protein insertase
MYDKKTWVVVTLCSLIIGYSFYDSSQKAGILADQRAEQARIEAFNKKAADEAKAKAAAENPEAVPEADKTTPPPVSVAENIIALDTAEVSFVLTNKGGGIKHAVLKNEYEIGDKKIPIHINQGGANPVGALTRGAFTTDALVYEYKADQSTAGKSAVFVAKSPEGLLIKKIYSIQEDQSAPGAPYLLNFDVIIENDLDTPIALNQWTLALGSTGPIHAQEWPDQTTFFFHDGSSYDYVAATKFAGGWFSDEKLSDERQLAAAKLAGVCDQFFTIALQPKAPYASSVIASTYDVRFPNVEKSLKGLSSHLRLPTVSLAKGEQNKNSFQIYMGPKDNNMLRKMGSEWGEIMNYGWFSPISRLLNWTLHWIHAAISKMSDVWSWGISIVILTLVVRIAIWPLYNKSNRSMKRMAKLKPEMDKLKEKYSADPAKMNQEVMKMYKKYGVNPIGGCLPMLLQIPIFFGFYRMLQYAVELRHEPFLGWVTDLSQPDTIGHIMGFPINILPIIMTLTSFAQMAMMPKTGDKMQQRLMMFMPFMFLIFCYSFASALALYWTTQNIFTIFQTWITAKMPEPQLNEKIEDPTKPKKKSFMEKMMEKQEELQRAQAAKARGESSDMRDVTPSKKPRPPKTGG